MRRLSPLLAMALISSTNPALAAIDNAVHQKCLEARDYEECIKAFKTKSEEEIEAEKREAKVKQKNTLNVVFQDFYDKYVVLNRKNPEPAMNLYDYHVRKVLGDLPFDEITLIECRDLIDSIKGKRAPQTVYSILKQCWIHQHGRGFLKPSATNPFLILKSPQVKQSVRDRLITDEEMRILWIGLGQAHKKVEIGVKLLTHTACRTKEINSLR